MVVLDCKSRFQSSRHTGSPVLSLLIPKQGFQCDCFCDCFCHVTCALEARCAQKLRRPRERNERSLEAQSGGARSASAAPRYCGAATRAMRGLLLTMESAKPHCPTAAAPRVPGAATSERRRLMRAMLLLIAFTETRAGADDCLKHGCELPNSDSDGISEAAQDCHQGDDSCRWGRCESSHSDCCQCQPQGTNDACVCSSRFTFFDEASTWVEAFGFCADQNPPLRLARVHSHGEWQFVKEWLQRLRVHQHDKNVWIGACAAC